MRKLFSFALILFACTVQASELMHFNTAAVQTMNLAPEGDRYAYLLEQFQKAGPASISAIAGWHAGRCYTPETRSVAHGSMLVSETMKISGGNDGPMFPPEYATKLAILGNPEVPAGNYDELTDTQIFDHAVMLERTWAKVTPISNISGSLVSRYDEGNADFKVRKSGNYIFALAVVTKDIDNYKAGDVFSACYYFKKVR